MFKPEVNDIVRITTLSRDGKGDVDCFEAQVTWVEQGHKERNPDGWYFGYTPINNSRGSFGATNLYSESNPRSKWRKVEFLRKGNPPVAPKFITPRPGDTGYDLMC
jgi:hypothetical protein